MIRNWLPRSVVALVAVLAFAGTATTANAQDKLDRALRDGKKSGEAQRVIFKAKPGYEDWARQLLRQKGVTIKSELPSIGGFAIELSAAELDAICQSAVSDGCSADTLVTPTAGPATWAAAMAPTSASRPCDSCGASAVSGRSRGPRWPAGPTPWGPSRPPSS